MKNLLLLFFIFISFSLFSQKYTVNRVFNVGDVFEIKDSLGKSVYQCFADTVILFQKADYAYIVKNKKIGLYAIKLDTLIFETKYSEIYYCRYKEETDFSESHIISILPQFQIEIAEKRFDNKLVGYLRFRNADKILISLDHSFVRIGEFANKHILCFNENFNDGPTEPYHRFLSDGTRIDSIAVDKNGNQILDCMGNPHFQYPPAVVYHKDIFIDLSNNKCIPFPDFEEAWFENDLIITYNDTGFSVYENSLAAVQNGTWKELFSDQQKFKQFYSRLFPKGVSPIYDSALTNTKTFYNSDEFSEHNQFEISVFKDGKCGNYMLFSHAPFWHEELPLIYDYASMHISVSGDQAFAEACSNKYILSKETSSFLSLGLCINKCFGEFKDCMSKSIDVILRGGETNLFNITRKEEHLIVNSFMAEDFTCNHFYFSDEDLSVSKLCIDSENKFKQDCPFSNLQNRSGIFNPKHTRWILSPNYSYVLPVQNGYLVYKVYNHVDNKKEFDYVLFSGLFDGENWTIPMSEQYLVEEKGVIMQKVNGKLVPIK